MRRFGAWLTIAALCGAAPAQDAGVRPGASLTFTLDRSGTAAVYYSVQLEESTGKGVYRGAAPATAQAATAQAATAQAATAQAAVAQAAVGTGSPGAEGEVPIAVPPAVLQRVFAAVPLVRSNRCESHRKNIAQTGTKTLRLLRDGAVAECSYNYSEDDRVNAATTVFEAIAETMQFGERLRAKLRFDRLGLDVEMDGLQAALNDGRALEVGNIAPVLQAIQGDDRVMERVRRKAAHLLESAGVLPTGSGA